MAKQIKPALLALRHLEAVDEQPSRPGSSAPEWTEGICPNCGYAKAGIDPQGVLWCPACGYSKKGCYT